MHHDEVCRRLKAWIDGELSPRAADQVREHLGGCASCRDAERSYRRIGEWIRGSSDVVVPDADLAGIRGRARRQRLEEERTLRHLRWVALAAAAVLVVSVGLWFVPGGAAGGRGVSPTPASGVAALPLDEYDALGTLFTNLDAWPLAAADGELEWDG